MSALPTPLTLPATLLLTALLSMGATGCGDDPLTQRVSDDLAPPAAADGAADPDGCVADPGTAAVRYRVRRGDTLSGIAQRLYGDATLWPEIAQANAEREGVRLGADGELRAGDELVIPFEGR